MNPSITCSSCRNIKCQTCFENHNNDRISKTCAECRVRKSRQTLIIKDKYVKEVVTVDEDNIIITSKPKFNYTYDNKLFEER